VVSRAQFLRGNFTGKRKHIRPPWTGSEQHLSDQCRRCTDCLKACPEQILCRDDQDFPTLDFRRGECTFCGECAAVCTANVFQPITNRPWSLHAEITERCLPLQGVVCGRCAESCETTAIRMKLVAGGVGIPQLTQDNCTGCGACFNVCPATAIRLTYQGES